MHARADRHASTRACELRTHITRCTTCVQSFRPPTHARSSARSQAHTCESCDARLGVRVVAHQLASAVPVSHTHLLHSTTQRNLISRYLVPGARDQRAFACAEFWISDDRERGGVVGRSCFSCSVEGRMHCKLMRSLSTTESHYHEWELLLFANTSCSLRSTRMQTAGRLQFSREDWHACNLIWQVKKWSKNANWLLIQWLAFLEFLIIVLHGI